MEQKDRKSVITHTISSNGIISFYVAGAGGFDFDPSLCTDEVERAATLHGYVQKISDKAAIARDTKTGASATPEQKLKRMKELADYLMAGGAWTMRAPVSTLNRAHLFTAVAVTRNLAPEKIATAWQSTPDKVLQCLLTDKHIFAEYARLTAPQDVSGAGAALLEKLEAE